MLVHVLSTCTILSIDCMYLVQSYPLIAICLSILITFLLLIAGELTYSSMLPYVQVFN